MNLELYLQKLGVQKKPATLEYLNELITAHQRTISFNNLAVFFHPGRLLNLELEPLFEKVIVNGEGGYCFENNKVFFYLLQGLGFNVTPRAGRVVFNKTGEVPRTHRLTIVTLQGTEYLADVGFGRDVPSQAISLGDAQAVRGHRVISRDDLFIHQVQKEDEFVDLYTFDQARYLEADFSLANFWTNTHPDSYFVKGLIVARLEPGFIEFISGKTYSMIKNGERTDIALSTSDEFHRCLRRFGIEGTYDFRLLVD